MLTGKNNTDQSNGNSYGFRLRELQQHQADGITKPALAIVRPANAGDSATSTSEKLSSASGTTKSLQGARDASVQIEDDNQQGVMPVVPWFWF